MGLLGWIVTGFLIGVVARFLVAGPHPLGCIGTVALGMIGSVVGGTMLNVFNGDGFEVASSGFFGSVFGAVIVLVLARLFGGPRARRDPPPR